MPLSRLISDPLQEIAPADREEFWREAIARNFSLSQSLVWFVLCILLVDIYSIDIRNVLNFPRSVVLAVMAMHTALFSACLVFLSLRRWCQASSTAVEDSLPAVSVNQVPTRQGRLAASTTTQRQLWLSQGFNLVLFALLDGASLISLVHVHTNSLYVIGIFIIAIVFFLPTTFFRMLYGVNFLLSLLALAMVGPAGPWRAAAFLSGVISTVLAWLFASLIFQSRVSEFLHTKTIQRQAVELQEANDALAERNQALLTLNQEKNEFLGIAAHDLKNPLNVVIGYSQMLLEEPDMAREEIDEYLGLMLNSSQRMVQLISNLLDVNAIERGEMKFKIAPCDLCEKTQRVVETFQPAATAKQQTLHFEPEAAPVTVLADADVMVQVLDNLVSNAVKYSPPGKSIFVQVKPLAQAARFEVQDQGPGFTAEDMQKLFGKFARLSARPTGGEHSTGLGLSIVKKLVEAMQGHVWCESEPGRGAKFVVELPRV